MPAKRKRSTPSPKPAPAAKRGPGRPPGDGYKRTAETANLVAALSGYGIPHEDIVRMVPNPQTGEPISPTTLRLHYRRELDSGHTQATARVAGALFKNAVTNENVAAQIFWMKARARWRQTDADDPLPPPTPPEHLDVFERARRVAFTLALAVHGVRPALQIEAKPEATPAKVRSRV